MAKAQHAKVEFEGQEYEYDPTALKSYSVIKAVSNPSNPTAFFGAFERIFCGNDVEYAERLGDSLEDMARLVAAVAEAAGSKN